MSASRTQRRKEFELDVKLMRQLGVARWEDIVLGPPPQLDAKDMTDEQRAKREFRTEEKRHETLFAASSVKPKLPTPPILKGVRQDPRRAQ